ncbi:metallophosphoesterase [Geomonas paludis]|uniref:Metallophosphoesterase n=1 Tax=Geomonas paludis TaxID=2740185 RepID=A0A6V8MYJ6_9BACT|nr:metallophosphoesterase [Geomonas paludis]UPU36506.1 metallophosphoesterase [Geomonas paludis]GFO65315.1 metallophosphoesterase [Geomonas paludis]
MTAISRRAFLAGGIAFFPYLYYQRVSVAVRRYRVPVHKLPPGFHGFTILHITDLHDKEFGERGEELLAILRRLSFDLVAVTGDLVLRTSPKLDAALDLIRGIGAFSKSPVFSVSGNHEWGAQMTPHVNAKLEHAGVRVLKNEAELLRRGKDRLWVVGVDDPVTGRADLAQAMSRTDAGVPRLLLAHAPHPFPQAVQAGVDLMLVGHTHGGQIRLPLIGAPYIPSMGYLPRWDYGLYRQGTCTMIVNGGLGESWFPIRINNPPEVALVTLLPTETTTGTQQQDVG